MVPKPLNNNIILRVDSAPTKSEGGILIPDGARETMFRGTIESVGKDVIELKKGDKVLFAKYVGSTIKVGGKEYLVMSAKDILAIVQE
jgi:chaperonin GroES